MSEIDWSNAPEGATHWMPESRRWEAGFWKREGEANYFFEGGEWRFSRAKPFGDPAMVKRPAPQWNGEGLPPVGACIEWLSAQDEWLDGRVVGHDGMVTVVSHNDGYTGCHAHEIRPIRTPEQIAAEERYKAIRAIELHILKAQEQYLSVAQTAQSIYDAGFQVPKQ